MLTINTFKQLSILIIILNHYAENSKLNNNISSTEVVDVQRLIDNSLINDNIKLIYTDYYGVDINPAIPFEFLFQNLTYVDRIKFYNCSYPSFCPFAEFYKANLVVSTYPSKTSYINSQIVFDSDLAQLVITDVDIYFYDSTVYKLGICAIFAFNKPKVCLNNTVAVLSAETRVRFSSNSSYQIVGLSGMVTNLDGTYNPIKMRVIFASLENIPQTSNAPPTDSLFYQNYIVKLGYLASVTNTTLAARISTSPDTKGPFDTIIFYMKDYFNSTYSVSYIDVTASGTIPYYFNVTFVANLTSVQNQLSLIINDFLDIGFPKIFLTDNLPNKFIAIKPSIDKILNSSSIIPYAPTTTTRTSATTTALKIFPNFDLNSLNNSQANSSSQLINITNNNNFDFNAFNDFTGVLKNFSLLNSLDFTTTNNLLQSVNDLFEKGLQSSAINGDSTQSKNSVQNLFSSLESIIQKTDFSSQTTNCQAASCYSIGKKNIGFTLLNNKETDINKRILGSSSTLGSDKLSFGFFNQSQTSSLFNNLDDSTKSAFFLNTSTNNLTTINQISIISFLVMKYNFLDNLNLQQDSSPSAYLSSIILKDSSNNVVSTSISVNILFKRDNQQNKQQACGFWDSTNLKWSTTGCQLVQSRNSQFYDCVCNHTTFFALLGGTDYATTESITVYVIAVCISIGLGSIVIILIVIKLSKIDKSGIKTLPAFYSMLSTFFSSILFILASLFMIGVIFNKTSQYSAGCGFLAFLEHFTLLAYFFWLLNTIMVYYFTNRFEIDNMLKYFTPFAILAFVLPFLITIILFFISLSSITVYEISNSICWLGKNYAIGTVIVPICLISIINLVFIIFILIGMFKSTSINSVNTLSKRRTNTFVILSCFLFSGITWVGLPFTLISFSSINYGVIMFFSVVNALQGVFLFIHFIFTTRLFIRRNKEKDDTPPGSRRGSFDLGDFSRTTSIKTVNTQASYQYEESDSSDESDDSD